MVHHLDQHVHVIWHDTPGNETVPLSIQILQRVLNELSDPCIAQVAGTYAAIGVGLDPLSKRDGLFGIGGKSFCAVQFLFPLLDEGSGHGVVKPEGDELEGVLRIEVGVVAARVPAFVCGRDVRVPRGARAARGPCGVLGGGELGAVQLEALARQVLELALYISHHHASITYRHGAAHTVYRVATKMTRSEVRRDGLLLPRREPPA
jgi:hypothetical protein